MKRCGVHGMARYEGDLQIHAQLHIESTNQSIFRRAEHTDVAGQGLAAPAFGIEPKGISVLLVVCVDGVGLAPGDTGSSACLGHIFQKLWK